MPILLKKPYQPGTPDPDFKDGYPHVQLTQFFHSGLTMAVSLEYQFGKASGEFYQTWVKGAESPTKVMEISGANVAKIWAEKAQDGESLGEAMRRCTYQYMIDSGACEGTIVDNPPLPPQTQEGDGEPAEAT